MKNRTPFIKGIFTFRILLISSIIFSSAISATAQNDVTVTLQLQAPYSHRLNDYLDFNFVIVTLVNNTNQDQLVKLKGSIEGDNDILITTDVNYNPALPIELRPFQTKQIFNTSGALEFLDQDNIIVEISPDLEGYMYRTGLLPEGNYTICLQALDFNTDEPLSLDEPAGCSYIPLQYAQAPELILPDCDQGEVQEHPIFTWTPVPLSIANAQVAYDLYIVEPSPLIDNLDPNLIMQGAISTGFGIFYKAENLNTNSFTYPVSAPPFVSGKKYYWAVQAKDLSSQVTIINLGISEACSFISQDSGIDLETISIPYISNAPACLNCAFTLSNTNAITNPEVSAADTFSLNYFTLKVTSITSPPDNQGKFSGEATIALPFLNSSLVNVRIQFSDIQINSDKRIIAATEIKAIDNPEGHGFMPGYGLPPKATDYPLPAINNMNNYFDSTSTQILADGENFLEGVGMELPFGIESDDYLFAITDLTLTPTVSSFGAAVIIEVGEVLGKIAVAASDICLTNEDLCGELKLQLTENAEFDFGINDTGKLIIRGMSQNPNDHSYIEFDSSGFKNLHIEMEYLFPTTMLGKPGSSDNVSFVVSTDAVKWDDWIAEVEFEDFHITDADDVVFKFDQDTPVFYDHSTVRHIAEIPDSMEDEKDPLWYGFFIPNFIMELPDLFDTGGPIVAGVESMLIGDAGVSMHASVQDIIETSELNAGEWGFSIDNLGVVIKHNNFLDGFLDGKLLLPIVEKNGQNYLDYNLIIDFDTLGNYQLNLNPNDAITVPLFVADMRLANTSNIIVSNNTNGFNAAATLNGDFDLGVDGLNFMQIQFQKMQLKTDENYFEPGTIATTFASPDKSMYGFSFGIDSVGIAMDLGDGARVGLSFAGHIGLSSEDFAPTASGEFIVWGEYDNGPKFDKVEVKSIHVDATIGDVVTIEGHIKFYEDHATWGDGFEGGITLGVVDMFEVGIYSRFGTTSYNNNNTPYDYFFVQGELGLGTGTPIFSGFALYSFSGGVGNRVIVNDPSDPQGDGLSPSATAGLSFTAGVGFGGHPGSGARQVLCGNITLGIGLSENNSGVDYLNITGDVGLFTNSSYEAGSGIANGGMDLLFDFAQDKYTAGFWVDFTIDPSIFTARGRIDILVKKQEAPAVDLYHVKVGTPSNPVTIDILGGLLTGGAYFETGNHEIDSLPPLPKHFEHIFQKQSTSDKPSGFQTMINFLNDPANTKYSLLHGANAELEFELDIGILYGGLHMGLGYGILISETIGGCGQYDPIGYNGWYALGQAYFAVEAKVGVRVWFFGDIVEVDLAKVSAGAKLAGGGLNPTWAEGTFAVNGTALGVIEIHENFDFSFGEKCLPATPEYLEGLELITDIYPDNPTDSIALDATLSAAFALEADYTQEIYYGYRHKDGEDMQHLLFRFERGLVAFDQKQGETISNPKTIFSQGGGTAHLEVENFFHPNDLYEIEVTAKLRECKSVQKEGETYKCTGTWEVAKYKRDDPKGNFKAGDEFVSTKTIKFNSSGEFKEVSSDQIAYAFPYELESRFCYKEDSNPGMAIAYGGVFGYKDCGTNKDQILKARFIPLTGSADLDNVQEVDVSVLLDIPSHQNDTHYNFNQNNGMLWQANWPEQNLLPSTYYAVQYVIGCESEIPTGTNIKDLTDPNITSINPRNLAAKFIADDGTIMTGGTYDAVINERKLNTLFIPKTGYKSIYVYVFKTSQFDNLEQKVASLELGSVKFYVEKVNWEALPNGQLTSLMSNQANVFYSNSNSYCDGKDCWVILEPDELDDVRGAIQQKLNWNDILIDWDKQNSISFFGPERFDVFDANGYVKNFEIANLKGKTEIPPIISFTHDGFKSWLEEIINDWQTWHEGRYLFLYVGGGQNTSVGGSIVEKHLDFVIDVNPDPAVSSYFAANLVNHYLQNTLPQSNSGSSNSKHGYNPNSGSTNIQGPSLSSTGAIVETPVLNLQFSGKTVAKGQTTQEALLMEDLLALVNPPVTETVVKQWAQDFGASYDFLQERIAQPITIPSTTTIQFNGHPGLITNPTNTTINH